MNQTRSVKLGFSSSHCLGRDSLWNSVKRFKFLGGLIHIVYSIVWETKFIVFFQSKGVWNCWFFPWLGVFSASRTALHFSAGFWISRSEEWLNQYILPLIYFTYHTVWCPSWRPDQVAGAANWRALPNTIPLSDLHCPISFWGFTWRFPPGWIGCNMSVWGLIDDHNNMWTLALVMDDMVRQILNRGKRVEWSILMEVLHSHHSLEI